MTAMVLAGMMNAPRLCYVNPAPSSVITNTAAETIFDQVFTFPSQSQRMVAATTLIRLRAFGIFSTGLINLNVTLSARWGGLSGTVIVTSGSFALVASATNAGWEIDLVILIQGTGEAATLEAQGYASFAGAALVMSELALANSGTFTIDTRNPSDLVLTAQWGTAASANQIQLRACTVEIDGP